MSFMNLPTLGVGLGYRPIHRAELFANPESVDFLEIVIDHYFDPSPQKALEFELLQQHFKLIPHGLALSLGSAEGIDFEYLNQFSQVVNAIRPAWYSEHIAFTRAGGIDIGHLTPLPKTKASLKALRDNIRRVEDRIFRPLILENITECIRYPEDEMSDAEFLIEICNQNDVGLLLDVTNLFINSINFQFDPIQLLHQLPPDRIVQLHFVGGYFDGKTWHDSHGDSTQEEIWQLLDSVVEYAPVKGIILERDDKIPPLSELTAELQRARQIMRAHLRLEEVESHG